MREVIDRLGRTIDFDAAMNLADPDLCEELEAKLCGCSDQEIFVTYAEAHAARFGEFFAPYFSGEW